MQVMIIKKNYEFYSKLFYNKEKILLKNKRKKIDESNHE